MSGLCLGFVIMNKVAISIHKKEIEKENTKPWVLYMGHFSEKVLAVCNLDVMPPFQMKSGFTIKVVDDLSS